MLYKTYTFLYTLICTLYTEFQNYTTNLPNSVILYSISVKTGFQNYCDTSYSRGDVNQMWIRKNSKDLLVYM